MHSTTGGRIGSRSGSTSTSNSNSAAGGTRATGATTTTTTSSSTARILGPTLFQDETNSNPNPKYIQQ